MLKKLRPSSATLLYIVHHSCKFPQNECKLSAKSNLTLCCLITSDEQDWVESFWAIFRTIKPLFNNKLQDNSRLWMVKLVGPLSLHPRLYYTVLRQPKPSSSASHFSSTALPNIPSCEKARSKHTESDCARGRRNPTNDGAR